jgi:tripartite-type tricarboxylate transporter receptor subunit TctC
MTFSRKLLGALAILGAANICATSQAATTPAFPCPARVIKLIIANPAGGVGDLIGRVYGERASVDLGLPVVIENHAGATTVIGTDLVAKAKPDGCTILSLTASGVVASVLKEKLPYSLERDFAPVIGIGSLPMVLAVPAGSKINSFADLVTAAKSADGITYGSGGSGTLAHLSAARLIKDLNGTGTHIPYRGNSDAIQGLLGNHVQLFFPSTAEAIPLVKSGKIKVLGVTAVARVPTLPDVPTMKDLGFADFNPRLWYALLVPASTPTSAIAALRNAFTNAAMDPSVRERLGALGFTSEVQDPAAVASLMKVEAVRWGKVIKDNDIKSAD